MAKPKELHPNEELTLGLIRESGVTDIDDLADTLQSEPYNLKRKEVLNALNRLADNFEIEIESFSFGKDGKIRVQLSDEEPIILLDDDC